MLVVVLSSKYAKGTNKAGKAYEGFFVDFAFPEEGRNGYKNRDSFINVSALEGVVPTPGMVLDLQTNFGSTFVNKATPIIDKDGANLAAFLAPFQQELSKYGK